MIQSALIIKAWTPTIGDERNNNMNTKDKRYLKSAVIFVIIAVVGYTVTYY